MAKILNKSTITTPICKLVELSSDYSINGQFYNKTDMSPRQLVFGAYQSSNVCEMATYKNRANLGAFPIRVDNGMVADDKNSQITYTIKPCVDTSNKNTYVYKTVKDEYGNVTITTASYATTTYSSANIIDQDDVFIYVSFISDAHQSTISKISKDTMTISGVYDFGINKFINVIKADEMSIYIAVTGVNNYFAVAKYNRFSGTVTIIKDDTGKTGGYTNFSNIINDPLDINTFYCIRDGWMLDGMHRVVIKKYVIDSLTDTVDSVYVNLELPGLTWGASMPSADNLLNVMNELILFKDGSKNYVSYIRYGNGISKNNVSLFVFEMMPSDTFLLKQEINFKGYVPSAVMSINNGNVLILSNQTQAMFYTWNKYSKIFEKTSNVSKMITSVASDKNENVFIQYSDTSVDMYSKTMPINIVALLEEETYDYKNVDLQASALVYAQNFSSGFVASQLKLFLIGPAKFTSTGSNVMTVSTSSSAPMSIPVTITGAGYIKISVELL